jgi:hypothetical protein
MRSFRISMCKNFSKGTREEKKRKEKKEVSLLITAFESCHSQQQIPPIIKACRVIYIRPLFTFLSCRRRGGYPEVSFLTVPVTAILRSFKAIADFQQTNRLLRNK